MVEGFAEIKQPDDDGSEDGATRERSSIAFPYGDLEMAIEVANALHNHGGGRGDLDSLAAWMGHESSKSGGFRLKVYTARDFGLIEIEKQSVSLLPLGRRIIDPGTREAARVEAFLHVPLYAAVYDAYKGGLLPKDIGLENQMQTLGVAKKQTSKARQVFARSAGQAGFFAFGTDRLVKPVVNASPEVPPVDPPAPPAGPRREDDTPPPPPAGEAKTITLRGGGTLTLSASVKFFELPRADRDFVFKLIDELAEYEDASTPKQLSAPKAEWPGELSSDAMDKWEPHEDRA